MPPEQEAEQKVATPFNWGDHPVIIASGSAVAGFFLCVAIFKELVVPTQLAKLELEALRAKETTREVQVLLTKISAEKAEEARETALLNQELKQLQSSNASLQQLVLEARAANLLTPGNPYPNGLGLVRIGMPRSEIDRVYTGHIIEYNQDDPGIVTVKLQSSPFERVTYYVTQEGKGLISHMAFHFPISQSRYAEDFVYRKLVESFGEPEVQGKRNFKWQVAGAYSLFAHRKDSYVLMRKDQEPVFWNI